jgi:uncharacterized protein YbbC (DUF1343 family)/CubicO group peptidase (beta-lactamase class C family)
MTSFSVAGLMRRRGTVVVCAGVLAAVLSAVWFHRGPVRAQAAGEFSAGPLMDAAIEKAIGDGQIPGAVLLIGRDGEVLYRKAYGRRALVPRAEAMTVDTIFDAASLTKVVATTSSLMKLVERGRLNLNDRVTKYLPGFQGGRSDITIRNLMTHFSGLRPDLDLKPEWSGYETGVRKALMDVPAGPPGVKFVYSDINFILLGEIVRLLGGRPLPEYARKEIFEPLGMMDTMYQPPASLRARIAPTELLAPGEPLRGVVHDETTRYMGGVAGHAGLFTTADDLARFCEMMVHGGKGNGQRIFSPLTVRKFTEPESPADQPILRGLGWDIDSPFSGNRGELFPIGSFGHTGFTGTSLWMDPGTKAYVILLTNSVHPVRKGAITPLRGKIATMAAAALGVDAPGMVMAGYNETTVGPGFRRTVARNGQVQTGLDVLEAERFSSLKGMRVGLITNHTGIDRSGRRNIDVMVAGGVNVKAIFSPEHGIGGQEDQENVANTRDAATGITVHSLYGKTRRPTAEMLREIDTLVFDIQDVGARFYTYSCTMAYALEEASKNSKEFVVLDRPNPITGVKVEGPMLDAELNSFVGCIAMPVRHGMTMGELATYYKATQHLTGKLQVIRMKGWQRGDWFDSTGLIWRDPSPNMRSLAEAILYPGVCQLEASKTLSMGRGTDAPFEQIGAEWMDGRALASYLNGRYIPGVRFYPTVFTPTEGAKLGGKALSGVRMMLTDREAFDSARLGMELAAAMVKLFPGKVDISDNARLIGNRAVIEAIAGGQDARQVVDRIVDDTRSFLMAREKCLLY